MLENCCPPSLTSNQVEPGKEVKEVAQKNYLEEHITHGHRGFFQGLGQGRPGTA